MISAKTVLPEITFKVIVLSIILAAVMSAANAYLALKIGQTISASIPASVLAIGILRFFKNSNVLESNLIQTAASAGEGVAAAIAFVLPAMIFIHAWNGFDYWETATVTALGGLLGVLFSIPLRRSDVIDANVAFSKGTAVGIVLRVTSTNREGTHMKRLVQGTAFGGLIAFAQPVFKYFQTRLVIGLRLVERVLVFHWGSRQQFLRQGTLWVLKSVLVYSRVLLWVWVIVLPMLSMHFGLPYGKTVFDSVMSLWSEKLRFVGVGVMWWVVLDINSLNQTSDGRY